MVSGWPRVVPCVLNKNIVWVLVLDVLKKASYRLGNLYCGDKNLQEIQLEIGVAVSAPFM